MLAKEKQKFFKINPDTTMSIADGYYVEARIPNYYFKDKISQINGDMIHTIGFMDLLVWKYNSKSSDYAVKDATPVTIRIPTLIVSHPSRIDEDKKNDMKVLEYMPGDNIIVSTLLQRNSDNLIKYVSLLLKGKLPQDIPYDKIVRYWNDCADINNVNLGVNIVFVDLIVMVVARDPGNYARMFREVIKDNPRVSMYARKLLNIESIPSFTSQFGALTSGNPKHGITSTIGAVKSGEMVQQSSDIEDMIV